MTFGKSLLRFPLQFACLTAIIALAMPAYAMDSVMMPRDKMQQMQKTNNEQRKNAAIDKYRQQVSVPETTTTTSTTRSSAKATAPSPGGTPDLFGPYPNWAWSPLPEFNGGSWVQGTGIRKFVDPLPTFSSVAGTGMNKQLSVAVPDTKTYPGCDYYEISLEEISTYQFHSDLTATSKVRGYIQTNNGTDGSGNNTVTPPSFSYAGPVIVATKNRPVRVKFTNALPTGSGGNLFIPTDLSMMGAGKGPDGSHFYSQNRAVVHLHGGMTPWISDGTPHQWITPAGESGPYLRGASAQNVPDMPDPGDGSVTLYYTNQQSSRLMFYHDHALGITRLNVYAGMFAGYMIHDDTEKNLETAGIIPPQSDNIPLVIEDRTFVDSAQSKPVYSVSLLAGGSGYTSPTVEITPATGTGGSGATATATVTNGVITAINLTSKGSGYTAPPTVTITDSAGSYGAGAAAYAFVNSIVATDPTWDTSLWTGPDGVWYPHVYMPNQTGSAVGLGANAMGRWDYALWFWPPYTNLLNHGLMANPYYDTVNAPWEPAEMPSIPNPSTTPEAFHDTPVVNGTAYPYLEVEPKAYRFRILNACNDRMLNLQLYLADQTVVTADSRRNTEVRMIPVPQGQSVYGKAAGIPDPSLKGPNMIQIGNEGGFLPAPVILTNTPIGYEQNPKNIVITNVTDKNLFLAPAERADVIVDFSNFAGTTLILYNDSPAPVPAFETRVDYYTGDPDQTGIGGAPTTVAGFGPNTRTIMQIRVKNGSSSAFNLTNLQNAFRTNGTTPGAFASSQHPVLVPQAEYNSAYNATFPSTNFVPIQGTSLSFTPKGATAPVTVTFKPKAIQELFETNYGRLNATLGVELPFTNGQNQTTVPLGYIEPNPDHVFGTWVADVPHSGDNTQIWKITHNGVDTHPVHFHIFDVQVINRVGWDGAIRGPDPNELGWKETVRMNPLEDCIVALRPVMPRVPFSVPNSVRLLDPTQPQGQSISTFDPNTGNPMTVLNNPTNFGWEYVWHCHILSHEENDMMHVLRFSPPPSVWGQLELLLLDK